MNHLSFRIATVLTAVVVLAGGGAVPVRAVADLDAGMDALAREDFARAYAAFEPAAKAGSAEAQYRIALLLHKGHGVAEDREGAVAWLEMAAAQGHRWALVALGDVLTDGSNTVADRERGIRLWQEAAQAGFPPALYRLSRAEVWFLEFDTEWFTEDVLARYAGEPRNRGKSEAALREEIRAHVIDRKATATMWMILAAEMGDERAAHDLSRVIATLSAAERAEAERRAKERRSHR